MNELKIVEGCNNGLMGMDEASKFLGIRKSTLYSFIMHKQIGHVKVGRLTKFTPDQIQAYINKNIVEPNKPGQ